MTKQSAMAKDLESIGQTMDSFSDLRNAVYETYQISLYKVKGKKETWASLYYLNIKPGACTQLTNEFDLFRLKDWFENTETRARDVLSRAETAKRKVLNPKE
jgi:hypothetical protein